MMRNERTDLLRKSTQDLIDFESMRIAIYRPKPLERDAGGGYAPPSDPPTLKPKVDRFVSSIAEYGKIGMGQTVLIRGRRFELTHIMVGPHDDDVEPGDFFTLNGKDTFVVSIEPNRSYQTKAYLGQEVETTFDA